jgi:hypothetical protein
LKEEFMREASPDIYVFDSITGITKRIETLLKEIDLNEEQAEESEGKGIIRQNRILLTGPDAPDDSWVTCADRLGFSLLLLNHE